MLLPDVLTADEQRKLRCMVNEAEIEKCLKLLAHNAVKQTQFLSSHEEIVQFFAKTASKSRETKDNQESTTKTSAKAFVQKWYFFVGKKGILNFKFSILNEIIS